MARYIDADALIKKIFPYDVVDKKCYTINAKMIYEEIQKAPTADVAPKSEVERLQHILDSYALQYGTVKDQHEVIDKVKTEVAREIFEEIERLLDNYSTAQCYQGEVFVQKSFDYELENAIAEFKKKYTGEQT